MVDGNYLQVELTNWPLVQANQTVLSLQSQKRPIELFVLIAKPAVLITILLLDALRLELDSTFVEGILP
jgi:hypothetical protein